MTSTFHEYKPTIEAGSRLNVSLHGTDKLSFVPMENLQAPTVEHAILSAPRPVDFQNAHDLVSVNGELGVWANKNESAAWRGEVPLSEYPINDDVQPEVIRKKTDQFLVYDQEVAIRYLRPPTPPPPGEIVLKELESVLPPIAPPLVIRQQPPRPETPAPVVIREAPPAPPAPLPPKIVTIPGKKLPPPPRKVVIERLPQLPVKPQSVIIERWLPYKEPARKVVFAKNTVPDPVVPKPKNVIIQWETPQVYVKKEYKDLGIIKANPAEYVHRYGDALKTSGELPTFVKEIRPAGLVLAAEYQPPPVYRLEGDIEALKLIDLDREGLSEYKPYVEQLPYVPPSRSQSTVSVAKPAPSVSGSKADLYRWLHYYDAPFVNHFLGEAFAGLDRDGDFKISRAEASLLLNSINRNIGVSPSEADVSRFVDQFDHNKDGFIDFQEFKRGVLHKFFIYESIEQQQQQQQQQEQQQQQ